MSVYTQDGLYKLNKLTTGNDKSIVYTSRDLGGGTATIGYKDSSGNFISLKDDVGSDVLAIPGEQLLIEHGRLIELYLQLSGSTTPDLEVIVRGAS